MLAIVGPALPAECRRIIMCSEEDQQRQLSAEFSGWALLCAASIGIIACSCLRQ